MYTEKELWEKLLKANSQEEVKALLGEAITDEQAAQMWRDVQTVRGALDEIEDDELKDVNGGYVFHHVDNDRGIDEYQVIDDTTGEVLAGHERRLDAMIDSRQRGFSVQPLVWAALQNLRREYKEACEREAEERRENIQRSRSIFLP